MTSQVQAINGPPPSEIAVALDLQDPNDGPLRRVMGLLLAPIWNLLKMVKDQ